jgi:hypothetical protein
VIWLGMYPVPLISVIQQTTAGLAPYRPDFRAVDLAPTPRSLVVSDASRFSR